MLTAFTSTLSLPFPQRWMTVQQHITGASFPSRGDVWVFDKPSTCCHRLTARKNGLLNQRDTNFCFWPPLFLSLSQQQGSTEDDIMHIKPAGCPISVEPLSCQTPRFRCHSGNTITATCLHFSGQLDGCVKCIISIQNFCFFGYYCTWNP